MSNLIPIAVFTRHNPDDSTSNPKCTYWGDAPAVPRAGNFIIISKDHPPELIRNVVIDLLNARVAVKLETSDSTNMYTNKKTEPSARLV